MGHLVPAGRLVSTDPTGRFGYVEQGVLPVIDLPGTAEDRPAGFRSWLARRFPSSSARTDASRDAVGVAAHTRALPGLRRLAREERAGGASSSAAVPCTAWRAR